MILEKAPDRVPFLLHKGPNFGLSSSRLAFVGALTERPCSEMLRIRRKWGEMVGLYRRAINDRPYYIIDTLFNKRQFVRRMFFSERGNCVLIFTEKNV